jgi:hypothetical protein
MAKGFTLYMVKAVLNGRADAGTPALDESQFVMTGTPS